MKAAVKVENFIVRDDATFEKRAVIDRFAM